jgi:hypothetical protein
MSFVPLCEVVRSDGLTLVHVIGEGGQGFRTIAQFAGQILIVPSAKSAYLFDVSGNDPHPQPFKVLDEVKTFALGASRLITCEGKSRVSIYDLESECKLISTHILEEALAEPIGASHVLLSPSEKFLLLRMHGYRALLFELESWTLLAHIPLNGPSGSASFVATTYGRELLFISSPSYLGIEIYDCESGQLLAKSPAKSQWDFCHVEYQLSQDGRRLVTYGCIWADAYVTRIYDTSALSWLYEANAFPSLPLETPLPLDMELMYRQDFSLGYLEMYLSTRNKVIDATYCDFVSLVELNEIPLPGTEDYNDLIDRIAPIDAVILDELRKLSKQHPYAIVTRHIHIAEDEVTYFHCWGCRELPERNVHLLASNQLLLVNEEIAVLDGQTGNKKVLGAAPFLAGLTNWYSDCTPKGDFIVVNTWIPKVETANA